MNYDLSLSYDTRGNVEANGKRSFDYNLAQQMVNSGSSSYLYDADNKRVKELGSKGASYSFYAKNGKLMYRKSATSDISYIYLGNRLVAKAGVVPQSNSTTQHSRPFGSSIEGENDDAGYTGHKFDTDLGLSYMQARYYDPVIGRFYSNDPVDSVTFISEDKLQGFNRYAYAFNNPYKYTDPDGKNPDSKFDRRIKPIARAIAEAVGGKKAAEKVEARFTLMNPKASTSEIQKALNVVRNKPKNRIVDSTKALEKKTNTKAESLDTKNSDVRIYESLNKVGPNPERGPTVKPQTTGQKVVEGVRSIIRMFTGDD